VPAAAVPPLSQTGVFRYLFSHSAYIANYIKSTINFIMINKEVSKNPELVADLFTYIRYLEECIKYSREPYEKYKEIIDLGLFSSLDRETLKSGYKLV
jgi:hypothetical protein